MAMEVEDLPLAGCPALVASEAYLEGAPDPSSWRSVPDSFSVGWLVVASLLAATRGWPISPVAYQSALEEWESADVVPDQSGSCLGPQAVADTHNEGSALRSLRPQVIPWSLGHERIHQSCPERLCW